MRPLKGKETRSFSQQRCTPVMTGGRESVFKNLKAKKKRPGISEPLLNELNMSTNLLLAFLEALEVAGSARLAQLT
jgi:hypothetical protein